MTATNAISPRTSRIWSGIRLAALALALTLGAYFIYRALRFFTFDPAVLGKYFPVRYAIMGHIVGGAVALLTFPFQLWRAFRTRYRRAHRVMGRMFVGGASAGAACALFLATTTAAVVGFPYALSLHMLAVVWVVSAVLAWRTAVHKRFAEHEAWANRSAIATAAFVAQSLSFELPFVARLGTFAEVATTLIWFSWTVPMFGYECVRAMKRRSP